MNLNSPSTDENKQMGQIARTSFKIRIPTGFDIMNVKAGNLPEKLLAKSEFEYRWKRAWLNDSNIIFNAISIVILFNLLYYAINSQLHLGTPTSDCFSDGNDNFAAVSCGNSSLLLNAAFVESFPIHQIIISSSVRHEYLFSQASIETGLYSSTFRRSISPSSASTLVSLSQPRKIWPTGNYTQDVSKYLLFVKTCRVAPLQDFQPLGLSSITYQHKDTTNSIRETILASIAYSRANEGHRQRHAIELFQVNGKGDDAYLTWVGCIPIKRPNAGLSIFGSASGHNGKLTILLSMDTISSFNKINHESIMDHAGVVEDEFLFPFHTDFFLAYASFLQEFVRTSDIVYRVLCFLQGTMSILNAYYGRILNNMKVETGSIALLNESSERHIWNSTLLHDLTQASPSIGRYKGLNYWIEQGLIDNFILYFVFITGNNQVCRQSITMSKQTCLSLGNGDGMGYLQSFALKDNTMFVLESQLSYFEVERCISSGNRMCSDAWKVYSIDLNIFEHFKLTYTHDRKTFGPASSISIYEGS